MPKQLQIHISVRLIPDPAAAAAATTLERFTDALKTKEAVIVVQRFWWFDST
jgi:hypothetical protein